MANYLENQGYSEIDIVGGVTQGAASGSWGGVPGMLIGGGLGLAGSLFSNRSSAKNAQAQRDWEEYMSSTAHQREVADLRAAGLNPVLSATKGGASTPSVGLPQVSDAGSAAVSGAVAARRSQTEFDMSRSTIENVKADTSLKRETESRTRMDKAKLVAETSNVKALGKIMSEQLSSAKAAAVSAKLEEGIDTKWGGWPSSVMRWINRLSESVQGAGSAADAARRGVGGR